MNENDGATNNDILDAINRLNDNTVATYNSITDLQEYLISKDNRERDDKAKEEKKQEETKQQEEELKKQQDEEEASVLAEESARSQAETETYQEILVDIRDKQELSNDIFAGQLFFTGMIAGLLIVMPYKTYSII